MNRFIFQNSSFLKTICNATRFHRSLMIEFIITDQILTLSEIARKSTHQQFTKGETNTVQTLGSLLGTHSTRYSTEKRILRTFPDMLNCFQGFTSQKVLDKHLTFCSKHEAQHLMFPSEGDDDIVVNSKTFRSKCEYPLSFIVISRPLLESWTHVCLIRRGPTRLWLWIMKHVGMGIPLWFFKLW
jgi:hypothetical protein